METKEQCYKVVLAGDEGVGKTCIIHYLIQHRFVDGFHPTIAATTQDWSTSINEAQINIKIWDTAGQERYKSLAPVYFRDANAAILVFDPSLANPIDSIISWAEIFKGIVGKNAYIVVACNKIDLVQDINQLTKIILDIQTSLNCHVVKVSAKTGENVFQLFQEVAEELYRRSPENIFGTDLMSRDSLKDQSTCPC